MTYEEVLQKADKHLLQRQYATLVALQIDLKVRNDDNQWAQEIENLEGLINFLDEIFLAEPSEPIITEGTCDGCGNPVSEEAPARRCHLKSDVLHIEGCWEQHLGECVEEN